MRIAIITAAVGLLIIAALSVGMVHYRTVAEACALRVATLDAQVRQHVAQAKIAAVERKAAADAAEKRGKTADRVLSMQAAPGATSCDAASDLIRKRQGGKL